MKSCCLSAIPVCPGAVATLMCILVSAASTASAQDAIGLSPGQQAASSPVPSSSVILSLEWAPAKSVVRKAKGGDNWPITWAADGGLYSTYGDGYGFRPFVKEKLSLGLVRIDGSPTDFTGVNVRVPSIEQRGQGRFGRKAWGILSVDGVIYIWLGHEDRNGGQSRLAWSRDGGTTFEYADWKFEQFGLIGFVNFGQDNAGARDEYVYSFSHDGPRADGPADQFILMRVAKERVSDRSAWEFFVRRDSKGRAEWSKKVDDRGAVFKHSDACLRSGMSYNAPLRRYFWWQAIPQPPGHADRGDTRFDGGFGIYDAPEPWGPWTTTYFTRQWDIGPGEHGVFPTKWISPDGLTMNLVFSGDDYFSVREANLKVADPGSDN